MRKLLLVLLCAPLLLLGSCDGDGDDLFPKTDSLGTGWTKIPTATDQTIYDMHFIGNTGFFVADSFVFKSTDGGTTWQKIYQLAEDRIIGIAMGSEQNVILIPSSGLYDHAMYTSQNGGASFTRIALPDRLDVEDVVFVSPSVVYAAGEKFYKSTNGGLTWSSPLYDFDGYNQTSLHFLNASVGWVHTVSGLFKTVNGGVNWERVPTPGFDYLVSASVYFVSANEGYAGDETNVWKTINGGTSWTKVYHGDERTLHDLRFFDSNNGYITGIHLYKTNNGGQTWARDLRIRRGHEIVKIFFTDAYHGWASGTGGNLYKYVR